MYSGRNVYMFSADGNRLEAVDKLVETLRVRAGDKGVYASRVEYDIEHDITRVHLSEGGELLARELDESDEWIGLPAEEIEFRKKARPGSVIDSDERSFQAVGYAEDRPGGPGLITAELPLGALDNVMLSFGRNREWKFHGVKYDGDRVQEQRLRGRIGSVAVMGDGVRVQLIVSGQDR